MTIQSIYILYYNNWLDAILIISAEEFIVYRRHLYCVEGSFYFESFLERNFASLLSVHSDELSFSLNKTKQQQTKQKTFLHKIIAEEV